MTGTLMDNTTRIRRLRHLILIEGVSFLVLLFVAVPLKHLAGMPQAVSVAGWLHGLLCVLVIVMLVRVMSSANWRRRRAWLVFIGAMLPFGPFVINHRLKRYQLEAGKHDGP